MYNDPSAAQTSVFEEVGPIFNYASAGQRFVDYLIDYVIVYIAYYIFMRTIGYSLLLSGQSMYEIMDYINSVGFRLECILVIYIFFFLYYMILEGATHGITVGKLASGVKAIRDDGQPITWKDATLRSLCRLIPFNALSAFGGHPWHDTITKTAVIKTR